MGGVLAEVKALRDRYKNGNMESDADELARILKEIDSSKLWLDSEHRLDVRDQKDASQPSNERTNPDGDTPMEAHARKKIDEYHSLGQKIWSMITSIFNAFGDSDQEADCVINYRIECTNAANKLTKENKEGRKKWYAWAVQVSNRKRDVSIAYADGCFVCTGKNFKEPELRNDWIVWRDTFNDGREQGGWMNLVNHDGLLPARALSLDADNSFEDWFKIAQTAAYKKVWNRITRRIAGEDPEGGNLSRFKQQLADFKVRNGERKRRRRRRRR